MRYDYELVDGILKRAPHGRGNVSVYTNPGPMERAELLKILPIEEHTLDSMLDPDEVSRVEFEDDYLLVIWSRPKVGGDDLNARFEITTVGLVLQEDKLTVVERENLPLPQDVRHRSTSSLTELVLRGMQETVVEYQAQLRAFKQTSHEIQERLTHSIENRELLRMFDLSESLVFSVDAVDANGSVLRRLAANASRLGFLERETDLLDEVVIDNAQCSRQGHLYINVFAGLMDARGNIINNNMNVLLKNLTIVNVIFLPLGILVGIGGMSEFTMFIDHYKLDWRVAFGSFFLGIVSLGVVIWMVIRFWIARMMGAGRR